MRIARILTLVYLVYAAMLFSLQTRMIFPGHETQGQPYAEVKPRPGTELVRLKTQTGRVDRRPVRTGPHRRRPSRPSGRSTADPALLLRQWDVPELRRGTNSNGSVGLALMCSSRNMSDMG